ncbi:zinc transporter ZIP11-like [Tubulanus polymorphus]|uniref:zinc transporter ZIP11-like n=1 Tax=Tubulanus polymorphus TaxID=672921 RepID=UPI003DA555E8
MLAGINPVFQAILGTFFTWGLTAAGSALVFVFSKGQRKVLDGSLGFAAGVMTAASYWSLLAPAIEMAENSGMYGKDGQLAFIPVSVGFSIGAAFVYYADVLISNWGITSPNIALALGSEPKEKRDEFTDDFNFSKVDIIPTTGNSVDSLDMVTKRRAAAGNQYHPLDNNSSLGDEEAAKNTANWKRILLLIIAITIHNIPEGLAVGVGFGAIGKSKSATFESARNLAVGIGIQNFPEGLAVSLPLRGAGMSTLKSFWYGQLSGMVEPIAGFFGAIAVVYAEPLLPYALAFAAGAMIYVVVDDIIPEAQMGGNGKYASCGAIVGFVVMMALDVGLG